ncbi:MAG: DUF4157 domain-containing protein [Candidatus Rokuibacteriota bacterium]
MPPGVPCEIMRAMRQRVRADPSLSTSAPTASRRRDALHPALRLQRSLGNRAVRGLIQAKLSVGSADDPYERQADHIADQVMRGGPVDVGGMASLAAGGRVQRACPSCEEELAYSARLDKKCPRCERAIRRKETCADAPDVTPDLEHELGGLRAEGGRPLPGSLRTSLETRLGFDLGDVRLHTGGRAADTARALDARAFTLGRDVVFGAGQYAPDTANGQRLIAHELAHTIQQGAVGAALAPASRAVGDAAPHAVDVGARPGSPRHIQRVSFGEAVELDDYLRRLRETNRIEDDFDSDNKARAITARWKRGDSRYAVLTVPIKVLLIREMLSGFTGDDDEDAILDLLGGSPDHELAPILRQVTVSALNAALHFSQQTRLDELLASRPEAVRASGQQRQPPAPREGGAAGSAFSLEAIDEAREAFMQNALLGAARDHCIGIIHKVAPRLFGTDEGRRVTRELGRLRQKGETYTMNWTGRTLARIGLVSAERAIRFDGGNGAAGEPTALTSSAWDAILEMVGKEYGWHIFGMAIFEGYHSVAVFVDNRPDGVRVFWADQWAIDRPGEFGEETGSASGFRRYERDGFDGFIDKMTHRWWCHKNTCNGVRWSATLRLWHFRPDTGEVPRP